MRFLGGVWGRGDQLSITRVTLRRQPQCPRERVNPRWLVSKGAGGVCVILGFLAGGHWEGVWGGAELCQGDAKHCPEDAGLCLADAGLYPGVWGSTWGVWISVWGVWGSTCRMWGSTWGM